MPLLLGAALSAGMQKAGFDFGGGFRQDEFAVSLYAGVLNGPWWLDLIRKLRAAQIRHQSHGPDRDHAAVEQRGDGGSQHLVRGEWWLRLRHGPAQAWPVAGLTLQTVRIDGFAETGSFTSLELRRRRGIRL